MFRTLNTYKSEITNNLQNSKNPDRRAVYQFFEEKTRTMGNERAPNDFISAYEIFRESERLVEKCLDAKLPGSDNKITDFYKKCLGHLNSVPSGRGIPDKLNLEKEKLQLEYNLFDIQFKLTQLPKEFKFSNSDKALKDFETKINNSLSKLTTTAKNFSQYSTYEELQKKLEDARQNLNVIKGLLDITVVAQNADSNVYDSLFSDIGNLVPAIGSAQNSPALIQSVQLEAEAKEAERKAKEAAAEAYAKEDEKRINAGLPTQQQELERKKNEADKADFKAFEQGQRIVGFIKGLCEENNTGLSGGFLKGIVGGAIGMRGKRTKTSINEALAGYEKHKEFKTTAEALRQAIAVPPPPENENDKPKSKLEIIQNKIEKKESEIREKEQKQIQKAAQKNKKIDKKSDADVRTEAIVSLSQQHQIFYAIHRLVTENQNPNILVEVTKQLQANTKFKLDKAFEGGGMTPSSRGFDFH